MGKRVQEDGVAASDVALLERVLERLDLNEQEGNVFRHMLKILLSRVEQYGADAYGLTERQREWVERVARRPKRRMSGKEFVEVIRAAIGRYLRL